MDVIELETLEELAGLSLKLCYAIEKTGCSESLTEASMKASDLYRHLENYWKTSEETKEIFEIIYQQDDYWSAAERLHELGYRKN